MCSHFPTQLAELYRVMVINIQESLLAFFTPVPGVPAVRVNQGHIKEVHRPEDEAEWWRGVGVENNAGPKLQKKYIPNKTVPTKQCLKTQRFCLPITVCAPWRLICWSKNAIVAAKRTQAFPCCLSSHSVSIARPHRYSAVLSLLVFVGATISSWQGSTVWWSRNKQKWGQLRLSAEWLNLNPHRNSFTGPSAACSSNERLCNFAHVVLILSLCRLQNDSCQVQVDSHCVGRNSVANPPRMREENDASLWLLLMKASTAALPRT